MVSDNHADGLAEDSAAEIVDRLCAAVTEPCPVGVDAGPVMSVKTPILTTSSEICAKAYEPQPNTNANEAAAIRLFWRMHPSLD
jgi:hypothetical protein